MTSFSVRTSGPRSKQCRGVLATLLALPLLACSEKREPAVALGSGGSAQTGGAPSGGASGSFAAGGAQGGYPSGGGQTSGGAQTNGGQTSSGGQTSDGGRTSSGGYPSSGGQTSGGATGAGGLAEEAGTQGFDLPTESEALAASRLVNDYFTAKWPDPTIALAGSRPSNLWTRAIYFEGLLALYAVETDVQRKQAYYDYSVRWAATPSHPWQVTYGDDTTVDADYQACGQSYLDLYAIDPKPERVQHIQASVDNMVSASVKDAWSWIDAIQMAMPVFVKLGATLGDTHYFDAMWPLYSNARDERGLLEAQSGLWWRDAKFVGTNIHWSRGNGWVLAALARVLEQLPDNDAHRATYLADFRALARALLPLQQSDGFWSANLTDPKYCANMGKPSHDEPETSGTALFSYGLAWGIRRGVLERSTYEPALAAAWHGLMTRSLKSDGFLGWVQSTGSAPCDGSALGDAVVPDFEDFGVGCFLLAGSELARLAQ